LSSGDHLCTKAGSLRIPLISPERKGMNRFEASSSLF
jgi:hypothetical protein